MDRQQNHLIFWDLEVQFQQREEIEDRKEEEERGRLIRSSKTFSLLTHLNIRAEAEEEKARQQQEEIRREEESGHKINFDAKMPKHFTELRRGAVLNFFIDHFLKMARKSNEFRNEGQAYLYTQVCRIISKVKHSSKQYCKITYVIHSSAL